MAIARLARFARQAKRPYGLWVKMAAVAVLGLCFIVIWSIFSSSSTSVRTQRESFGDINEPVSADTRMSDSRTRSNSKEPKKHGKTSDQSEERSDSVMGEKDPKPVNESVSLSKDVHGSDTKPSKKENQVIKKKREKPGLKLPNEKVDEQDETDESEGKDGEEEQEEEVVVDGGGDESNEGETNDGDGDREGDGNLVESEDQEQEPVEEAEDQLKNAAKKRKFKGPVLDPKAHYNWKPCSTRSKQNYIPCIDNEGILGKSHSTRHSERSCPKMAPMCLVPLPRRGYETPVKWPESKVKIHYKNVAHPKLSAFVKGHSWVVESGEQLVFPQNLSEFKGGAQHYLEFIEEMVPDIEWGKNIRVVLDIDCMDSSFAASLLDKDVIILSLGLKDDSVDLAQVALERGFPAVVSPFGSQRLPFPSMVFDAIHCRACKIPWHHNGGKILLEMNRILRPSGYFILSSKHDTIEGEEAMSSLTASICWNILAHKTDEESELGVRVYQKPESNNIYELRRKNIPPLCKEDENPDASWYIHMKTCLHTIPASIEQRGTEWPEEWPKRLEALPEWLENKEKLSADTIHWKSIFDNSYLIGIGIDWATIRNVMDMKAIYGGFGAALSKQNVWVMNVVPVNAPNTLPVIFERGLLGIYHDWCESFGTYPRSYDLLHADHLFSRLKNRCKQPVGIVVEMDRILRPGGWVVIRDKVEILDPLEGILRSLHWEIRMTFTQGKEGILCAQKTSWRPPQ